jgi:6-phosphogluconolactonase
MRRVDYPDRAALARGVAEAIATDLAAAIARRGGASLALPGGTTPGPVFDLLADVPLDWGAVTVLAGDERWVPLADPRSNSGQIAARLMRGRAAVARLVALAAPPGGDPPEAHLSALIAQLYPALPPDVALFGMGEDMHVASLFPGAPGLAAALAADAPALVVIRPADQPEARLSLSAPVIAATGRAHLMLTGAAKADALARAAALGPAEAPVCVLPTTTTIHWAP